MDEYIINAFTREGNNTNLEINNLSVGCITSKDNKFELDSEGNLTVKSITAGDVRLASQLMRDFVYPVGSVYITVDARDPNELFGGEWEQIKDTFLLASGDKYTNGSVGGEETHKLTIEEMPAHTHQYAYNQYKGQNLWGIPCYQYTWDTFQSQPATTQSQGGNKVHNNMPPYLAVTIWKRIK